MTGDRSVLESLLVCARARAREERFCVLSVTCHSAAKNEPGGVWRADSEGDRSLQGIRHPKVSVTRDWPCQFGWAIVEGVTLPKDVEGRLGLSWPERTDRVGRLHLYIRPIDDAARREIEDEVVRELTRQELEGAQVPPRRESKP